MLDQLRAETFEGCLHSVFELLNGDESSLDLRLEEVARHKGVADATREGFSLIFVADGNDALPQKMYQLKHQALGELDIFLVPIGPGDAGMRYEAVFT